jgi:hypothetical protein
MIGRRLHVAGWALVLLTGCQNRNTVLIPNRVLDRPTDLTLHCVFNDGESVTPSSLEQCRGSVSNCAADGAQQLIGFITNSERNEVALFRKCGGELVDMDIDAPGYQFVPVGSLPSSITSTTDGCSAIVANVGSCDLSVLDAPALAATAVEIEVASPASSLVARVVPRRPNGEPLASRPGQVIAAPPELMQSVGVGRSDPPDDLDELTQGLCWRGKSASVYVTFPSCHLLAELDLLTGRLLQSRQFVRDPVSGEIEVVDAGSDPECPIECPEQFAGAEVPELEGDPDGAFPLAMALVRRPVDPLLASPAEQWIEDSTLFVGGSGSDQLFEVPLVDGVFAEEALSLRLAGARGIQGIRPTPAMFLDLDGQGNVASQFVYVIAGDGSTRVIRRELSVSRTEIGAECDAQGDPTAPIEVVCNPVDELGSGRRPFAEGPGIRAPQGAMITDWSFQEVALDAGGDFGTSPFTANGVVGIGVTNFGRVVFSTFGQFKGGARSPITLDPLELMTDLRVLPHMLWPSVNPTGGDSRGIPRVQDQVPNRLVPGAASGGDALKVLAPTLRQVDLAYTTLSVANEDGFANPNLGDAEVVALYKNAVARVLPRDYREWRSGDWRLRWEGEIPGADGSTGQLSCTSPGNYEASCLGGSKLVDSAADFCDDGVLAGDKLFLFGCSADSDCGLGQVCLKESASAPQNSGICVSEGRFQGDPALADACRHFIHDPCGAPQREFLITKASQTELELQALDVPRTSVLWEEEIDGAAVGSEEIGRLLCAETQPDGGCEVHEDCEGVAEEGDACESSLDCPRDREGAPSACDPETKRCQLSFPYCYDGRCRRACDEAIEDCALRRLPGPRCFSELVRYSVLARNSFVVNGPGVYSFLNERVRADADGRCYEDPSISTLLTSRIRLDVDAEGQLGLPSCPGGGTITIDAPNPCLINAPRPAQLSAASPERLFHRLLFADEPIPAIRYSNPMFSLVLDLTSPIDLARDIPGLTGGRWSAASVAFQRSRIPRSYTLGFTTLAGYNPYNEGVLLGSVPLAGPTRVVNAPETGIVYVVDASGRGGAQGIRGQVMRVLLSPSVIADESFIVR